MLNKITLKAALVKCGLLTLLIVGTLAGSSANTTALAQNNAALATDTPIDMAAIQSKPEYPGGLDAMEKFVLKNFKWTKTARTAKLSGKIFASFVVERDGRMSDIKIIRDLGEGTGEEAVRVLKLMPKWDPGVQNGRSVRVAYVLPLQLAAGN